MSPTTLKSTRRSLPTVPTTTGPVWIPARIRRGRWPAFSLLHLLIELHHLPVDGKGSPDGPLRGILQSDRGAEEGHDPVTGQFVDGPFVFGDLVDEDLIDLVP